MKNVRLTVLVVAVLVPMSVVAQMAEGPGLQGLQISANNRTLSVSASDHAEADADVADLSVGFVTYGMTLKAAYASASDSSNAIVKAMVDAGAKRTEIQSRSQRVSRLQDYEIKAQKGMKYSVAQSWTVSVDPKTAALVLDAAVQAGANQSGDINWRLKNSIALDGEAIRRATERARAMAAELAKSMGVGLGKPLYATNSVSGNVVGPRVMMNGFMGGQLDKNKSAGPLAIEAQRVQADATVQIVYAIE